MQGFRLLRASGTFERMEEPSNDRYRRADSGLIEVEFAPATQGTTGSWVSVIIGRNGVGKSRLLAGIAEVFERIDGGMKAARRGGLSVSQIEYIMNGDHCRIELDGRHHCTATKNGMPCSPIELPLPRKVIALTTTPFDKFRISRSLRRIPDGSPSDDDDRYSYLGLRDGTGRASTTAAIFRALEGLFEASKASDERRLRIADVFEFLGYEPRIEVKYRLQMSRRSQIESLAKGAPPSDKFTASGRPLRPIDRLWEDPKELEIVRDIAVEVLQRLDQQKEIALRADFLGHSGDDSFFRRIQRLRRLGLLHMSEVEVERRSDSTVLDLRLASSGELGIVTGFLGLASVIDNDSLVFVDEPEISLHPEWQTNYVELLTNTFRRYLGCHFVLATHSPLILADINPEASNVVSLDPDRRRVEDARDYAGKSYDFLLATAFDEPGKNNLYLKEEIIKALRLAADGEIKSRAFTDTLAILSDSLPKLDQQSPVAQLIKELQAAATVGVAP